MEYVALDVHKHYTWARVENDQGHKVFESVNWRIVVERIKNFIKQVECGGTPVAVETVGNWYWVVDEIEAGKGSPQLVNARLAKLMIGSVNKSDKLECEGNESFAESRNPADGVDCAVFGW